MNLKGLYTYFKVTLVQLVSDSQKYPGNLLKDDGSYPLLMLAIIDNFVHASLIYFEEKLVFTFWKKFMFHLNIFFHRMFGIVDDLIKSAVMSLHWTLQVSHWLEHGINCCWWLEQGLKGTVMNRACMVVLLKIRLQIP